MNIYEQPRSPVPNKKHQKSKDLSAREFSEMKAYYSCTEDEATVV